MTYWRWNEKPNLNYKAGFCFLCCFNLQTLEIF
jgi:hypothetical protein